MSNIKPALTIAATIIAIFILTKNPITSPFKLQMALAAMIALIAYTYFLKKRGGVKTQIRKFIFIAVIFDLFLVAATGWFFSPFFFTLYLIAVFLSFIFPLQTALSFVITLALLFSFNIGEIDAAYDFLVILSFLSVVPLIFYLRSEYLRFKKTEKEIIVIKQQEQSYKNKTEEAFARLTFRLQKIKTKKDYKKNIAEIIALNEKALRVLNGFEENAKGKKLILSQTLMRPLSFDED